jgi:hypothetical protein
MATPTNINFLSPTGFQLTIEKLPTTVFFAQEVELPSVSFGSAAQNTPMLDIPVLGDKLDFGEFVLNFVVDEDMKSYKEIFSWMVGVGHPESLDQYAEFHQLESHRLLASYNPQNHSSLYSDGTLAILTNNSNLNHNTINFVDMFPVKLSGLKFSTTINDISYLTCTAVFKYSNFKFI